VSEVFVISTSILSILRLGLLSNMYSKHTPTKDERWEIEVLGANNFL
jgi:hypothetical protein